MKTNKMFERDEDGYLVRKVKSRYKLTPHQVIEIRELYAAGEITQEALAALFKVSTGTISRIVTGSSWAFVGGPIR